MRKRSKQPLDVPLPNIILDEDFKLPVAMVGRGDEKPKDVSQHILSKMAQHYFEGCSDHHCGIIADLYLRRMYEDQTQHEVFKDESMNAAWQEAFQRQATYRPVQELVGALMKGMMYFSQDDADVVAGAEKILHSLERGTLLLPIG